MSASQQVICPKCGRADAVRKVSNLVAEGTRTGEIVGIGLGIGDRSLDLMPFVGSSTSRSLLAAKLSPPTQPVKPHGYGWTAALIFFRLGLALFVAFILIGLILLSFPLLINTYSQNRTLVLIPLTIIGLYVMATLWWIILSARRDVRIAHEKRESYESRLKAWRRAKERWGELYYCARDDEVFIPKQLKLLQVKRTNEFTNAHNSKKKAAYRTKSQSRNLHTQ